MLTSYKTEASLQRWTYVHLEDGTFQYEDEDSPTPNHEDLRAVTAWGDIDLVDELKLQRGALDTETRATAEATLQAYIDAFAELYGGRDALDSVGGAYIFGAPEATIPIGDYVRDEHGAELAGEVLQAAIDRTNEYLKAAQKDIEAEIDDAAEVIDPDWANNHNRKYKTSLSIHKDHAAVVTPLDVDDVDYRMTPLDVVDDDLIADACEWAADFTAVEHTDRAENLVATLWADEYAEHGDWRAALDAWVAEREAERESRERRQGLRMDDEPDRDRDLDLKNLDITPYVDDIEQAIDRLDIYQVADDTIVSSWTERLSDATDRSGSGKKAIVPTWANGYNSGNATYVDEIKGTFVDTANGDHGTAVEMALIDAETWSVGDIARGRDWARGVRHLQELGYDIPVWTPDAETASGRDEMPFWSLRRAARTLGMVDEDDLVERESDGDSDGTYLGFPDAETYNAALEVVEEAGSETGREPATPDSYDGGRTPVRPLDREAVFEPRLAWQAAAEVDPADTDVGLEVTADGDAWVDPDALDAQRAAARTAETVIGGGADAVRELVVRGRDPYAHPSAHLLLAGMIIGGDEVDVLEFTEFGFDEDREQTRVSRVEFNGATILWDRNQAGADVLNPPTFESDGRRCSVIGLDATGRKPLWDLAIGEDVVPRDIHKTPSARRRFLKDTLNLQVVCTDNTSVQSYSGSPASKNFGGDLELTKRVADEYGGQRLRADTITATTDPGLITTKKVLNSMGEESRSMSAPPTTTGTSPARTTSTSTTPALPWASHIPATPSSSGGGRWAARK